MPSSVRDSGCRLRAVFVEEPCARERESWQPSVAQRSEQDEQHGDLGRAGRAFVAGVAATRHLEGDPGEDRAGYMEEGAEQVEEQREVLHE